MSLRRARRTRGFVAALGSILVLSVVAVPNALAHPAVVRSDPADGSSIEHGPRTVRIWFNEGIVPRFSSGQIVGDNGSPVRLKGVRAEADGVLVLTPAVELGRGVYAADWTVLSSEDGHLRRGFVVFGVGPGLIPPTTGSRRDESVAAVDVVLRWLNFSLLAGLAGGLAVAFLVLDGAAARTARRRVLTWTLGCASLGIVACFALLLWQAATLAGEVGGGEATPAVLWDLVRGTRVGTLALVREAMLLGLIPLLFVLRTRAPQRGALVAAAALVVALAVVQALSGHAAAVSPGAGLAVAAAALHLLAAGVWMGGLAAAIVAFWPLREEGWTLARASLRRFGVLAALSVAVLVVTGLYYAARQVASLDALLTTLYGQALLVKVGFIAVAGAFGLLTAMLLHPRLAAPLAGILGRPAGWTPLGRQHLRPLLLAEVSAGLVVLAAAAVLTATLPARGPEFASASRGIPANVRNSLSATAEDVLVTLSAKPNRAGANVFQAIVASARRPAPAEIRGVTLRFTQDERTVAAPMLETAPDRYRLAGGYLTAAGTWRIEVAVMRGGPEDVVARFDWLTAPPAGRSPLVSDRPLEPFLVGASTTGLLLLLAAVGVLLFSHGSLPRWKRQPIRPFRGA